MTRKPLYILLWPLLWENSKIGQYGEHDGFDSENNYRCRHFDLKMKAFLWPLWQLFWWLA